MNKMKKTYDILTDEQVYNMIEKLIRVSDFELTEDNIGEMTELFGETFFDVYDNEYTLGGMSKQKSETFTNEIYFQCENILLEYLAEVE